MNSIVSWMIISIVALSALSQAKGDKPTLVVGIIIDQLRTDYIELLQAHFGEKGFNHLINDGAYFENIDFSIASPDAISSSAIILTGAYPNVNGIPGEKVFNIKSKLPELILNDASKIGNYISDTCSQ